jgi:cytochrome d ubiquinol oxidase subunit II
MLVGIVLRGSAFTFRTYDTRRASAGRRWGRPFAMASVATPVLLGICVGAIASGTVGEPVTGHSFADAYVWSWLSPFTLACGTLSLSVFAYLAALYLLVEAKGPGLREDFRTRALWSAAAVFVTGGTSLATAWFDAPAIIAGLVASRWAIALHLGTGACALAAVWGLWTRTNRRLVRVAGAGQVVGMLFGWYASMYPYVLPTTHTIAGSAAPPATLRLILGAVVAGFVVLVPSLWYLLRIFKGAGSAFERLERATGEYEVVGARVD